MPPFGGGVLTPECQRKHYYYPNRVMNPELIFFSPSFPPKTPSFSSFCDENIPGRKREKESCFCSAGIEKKGKEGEEENTCFSPHSLITGLRARKVSLISSSSLRLLLFSMKVRNLSPLSLLSRGESFYLFLVHCCRGRDDFLLPEWPLSFSS